MIKLRCEVLRTAFYNPDDHYTVLSVKIKGYDDPKFLVGHLLDFPAETILLCQGDWITNKRFGDEFEVQQWEELLPDTLKGIEKYLSSRLVDGIGAKYAQLIVKHFGVKTLDVIDHDIQRLLEIPRFGKKRLKQVKESWEKQKSIRDVMIFLQSHGVSSALALQIFQRYGTESIEKVKENPYRLADDIRGIGFEKADQIARQLGYRTNDLFRCHSGLLYALKDLAQSGHVFADRQQLIEKTVELLQADPKILVQALAQLVLTDRVKLDGEAIYLPAYYRAEVGTAQRLLLLYDSPLAAETSDASETSETSVTSETSEISVTSNASESSEASEILKTSVTSVTFEASETSETSPASKSSESSEVPGTPATLPPLDIPLLLKQAQIQYDEVQAQAIEEAVHSKILILTGGPGTGKTTTTRSILAAFHQLKLKVLLAAPTGRAAKRLSEATGLEAKTLHRLLEYNPLDGYQRNEENPLEGDALIVDECSMVDILLMYRLMQAVPVTMRLVFVGDIDQLPSVGAGNVLRDLIECGKFPVIRLTRIFRQAQTSRIVRNAHTLNQGILPDLKNHKQDDFFFIEEGRPEDVAQQIVELVQHRLPKAYPSLAQQIQVLTPIREGVVGTHRLNASLQAVLNPSSPGIRHGGIDYREGDRVMQIQNNYDKKVFNGDLGYIDSVDTEKQVVKVDMEGRQVTYSSSELDELSLAYATTIHKSQGSEYPIVVLPVVKSHFRMLQRNLIYTGITRAKRICILIGSSEALSYAVHNQTVLQRNTRLKERLREE